MSAGETAQDVSGWTTDTLRMALIREMELMAGSFDDRIEALNDRLSERYSTQTKALDAAFAAQQLAMTTAFLAADKAVAAALESAEKAVTKAEAASEKRFESVNEFRAQLSDQTATFMPRTESTARWAAVSEKLDTHASLADTRMGKLEARLEAMSAGRQGAVDSQARAIAFASGLAAVIGVLITLFIVLSK